MSFLIWLGAVAVMGLVCWGVDTGIDCYNAQKELKAAQRDAEKRSKKSSALSADITTAPDMKGASNSVATGATQPYIIGRHLFTPYIMNGGGGAYKGIHKIGGEYGDTQFYSVILEGGFNTQWIESLSIGDLKVADLAQGKANEGIYYFKSNPDFFSSDSFIEISQDGAGFETADFNKKIVEKNVSTQLLYADDDEYEDLIFTLEKNAMAADVIIMFNGLYAVDDDANKTKKKRTVTPYYSTDYTQLLAEGGDVSKATWKEFKFDQIKEEVLCLETVSRYSYSFTMYKDKDYLKGLELRNRPSSWKLINGDDFRDSNGNFSSDVSLSYDNTPLKNGALVTFFIKATKYSKKVTKNAVSSNDFKLNVQKQVRFNAHKDFSFSECFTTSTDEDGNTVYTRRSYPIAIKISTTDKEDKYAKGDCYVQYVQSTCFNVEKSKAAGNLITEKIVEDREAKLSTLIGLKIKATTANEDKLGKISIITNGIAPTWNSDSKTWNYDSSGDFVRYPTSNIASWLLEILTSKTHTPSQMEISEIDLDKFGEWYEYCEENGLCINKVLTSGIQKETLVSSIAEAGRAVLYQDTNGKLSVAWDRIQSESKMLFNNHNLMSFSWKKDMNRQFDGVKLTYIESENNEYSENSIVRMYNQYNSSGEDQWENSELRDFDSEVTEISGYGITNYNQACEYMSYIMNCAHARLKDVTCSVGKEAYFLRPYDRVSVAHSLLGRSDGSGTIQSIVTDSSGNVTGIVLREAVNENADEEFAIQIQCSGTGEIVIAECAGTLAETRGKEITLSGFSGSVKVGDLVSYGSSADLTSEDFIVRGIAPTANGFTLSLTEYDEKIFDFGTIPEYDSPLSLSGDEKTVNIPEGIGITEEDIERIAESKKGEIEDDLQLNKVPDIPTVSAKATRDSIKITCNVNGKKLNNSIKIFTIVLCKGSDDTTETTLTSGDSEFTYNFDRTTDKYPEASELINWTVKAKATNFYNFTSEFSEPIAVDTLNYGTWQVQIPNIASRVSGRNVTLTFSQPARSDEKEVYGTIRYQVQVKKTSEENYFKPAISLDPYISEDNYKSGSGYVTSGEMYQQVMPLEGQNNKDENENDLPCPVDTSYTFAIKAYNEANKSDVAEINIIALATSTKDIVDSAITTNKIADGAVVADKIHGNCITADKMAVADLAAISGTFGKITGGGSTIKSDNNNYWDLKTGEFRIGNDIDLEDTDTLQPKDVSNGASYLHFKKVIDGVYQLAIALSNFFITASASIIKGFFKVITKSGEDFLEVNPDDETIDDVNAKTFAVYGNIEAGNDIVAKNDISAEGVIKATKDITTEGDIEATKDITAGGNITATGEITAGQVTVNAKAIEFKNGLPYASDSASRLVDSVSLFKDSIVLAGAANDAAWIRFDESTANSGYLDIATGDNGSEPIYCKQYNVSNNVAHKITLMDASGNQSFNAITANGAVTVNSTLKATTLVLPTISSSTVGAIWLE